jgi:hypothetical protein
LRGCVRRPPLRHAGPATTLQYRVSHPGAMGGRRPHLRVVA